MGYPKEKQREYQREWIAARRSAFFEDKSCASCGSVENLEIDHIDPKTKVASAIWSWRQERRDQELSKCQVLCHSCHRTKTVLNGDLAHGVRSNLSKLTEAQVLEARKLYATGKVTFRELGERYNVHKDTIRHMIRGKSWVRLETIRQDEELHC